MNNRNISGIYNVGTGKSNSFNDIANTIIKRRKKGKINYIPFPKEIEKNYSSRSAKLRYVVRNNNNFFIPQKFIKSLKTILNYSS